jgi:hypothetical protein
MTSQPDALLAIEPAHLPHYTHAAVIVGSVIILAIITLVAGVSLAIAHYLVSAGPMTHRDRSVQHSLDEIRLWSDADSNPFTGRHIGRKPTSEGATTQVRIKIGAR